MNRSFIGDGTVQPTQDNGSKHKMMKDGNYMI